MDSVFPGQGSADPFMNTVLERGSQAELNDGSGHQIKRLLAARCIIAVLLLLIVAFFYFYPLPKVQSGMLIAAALLQALLLLVQWLLTNTGVSRGAQVGFQLLGDMLLVSVLLFVTGGLDSPFALLFGLLIIAAGTQTQAMLAITVAVAASACYLGSVYLVAWHDQHVISVNESLTVLMQVSAFLLVGGVMGYIARHQKQLVAHAIYRTVTGLHVSCWLKVLISGGNSCSGSCICLRNCDVFLKKETDVPAGVNMKGRGGSY